MNSIFQVVGIGCVVAGLAGSSHAQSFNIDIGNSPWFGPVPAPTYAAATGVAGVWNEVGESHPSVALVDVNGAPTSATTTFPANAAVDGWIDIPNDAGDLMNDYQTLGHGHGGPDWSIQGIANGDYRVTFYSRLSEGYWETGATVFTLLGGSSGPQLCDGSHFEGFTGFRYGINMVQDTVTVSNNTLSWHIMLGWTGDVATFNGVQIELLVPGSVHTYCAAKQNSLGCLPMISSSGTPSVSGGTFAVTAANVRSHRPGFLLWGPRQNGMLYQFGPARLCVARPFIRTGSQDSGGTPAVDACSGRYTFTFDTSYLALHGLTAGDSVPCQYWAVDENAPAGASLTKGSIFVLAP